MTDLQRRLIDHGILWLVAAVVMWLAWTGFIASDDEYYVRCGLGWLHHFPFVAGSFGEVRAAVCIPMALAIGVLGESEFAASFSTMLFYAGSLSLGFELLRSVIDRGFALSAAAVLSVMPLLALSSTIPGADLPELFFVIASLSTFWHATRSKKSVALLVFAGVLAALAFSAHEQTVALLLFYGVLFLAGYGVRRAYYWLMALGFLGVLGLEMLYFGLVAGEPLHRFQLLVKGASGSDRIPVGFLQFTDSGTLHVWEPVDPIVMLFTHVHYFSIVAYLSIPALAWAFRDGAGDRRPDARRLARLLGLLGIVWFAIAAVALSNFKLLPRYYLVPGYCLFLVCAIWIVARTRSYRPRLAGFAVLVVIAVSLFGVLFSNKNPRFGERVLAAAAQKGGEILFTDPMTAEKIEWYCRWAGSDCGQIVGDAPAPGALYLYNPKNADRPNRLVPEEHVGAFRPESKWEVVWRRYDRREAVARFFDSVGLSGRLPQGLERRFVEPNPPVTLYRIEE